VRMIDLPHMQSNWPGRPGLPLLCSVHSIQRPDDVRQSSDCRTKSLVKGIDGLGPSLLNAAPKAAVVNPAGATRPYHRR
jgi:hypothetical protein